MKKHRIIVIGMVLLLAIAFILRTGTRPGAFNSEIGIEETNDGRQISNRVSGFKQKPESFRVGVPEAVQLRLNKPPVSDYPTVVRFLATQRRLLSRMPKPEDIPYLHPSVIDSIGQTNQSRLEKFVEMHERKHKLQEELNSKLKDGLDNLKDEYGFTSAEKLSMVRALDLENSNNPLDSELAALDKKFAEEDGTVPPGTMAASRVSDFLIQLLDLDRSEAVVLGAINMGSMASAQSMFLVDGNIDNSVALLKKLFGNNLTEYQIEQLLTVPHDKLFTPISNAEYLTKKDAIMERMKHRIPGRPK